MGNWFSSLGKEEQEAVNLRKYWCFHKNCPRHKIPTTIEECHEHLMEAHSHEWFLDKPKPKTKNKKKKKR